MKLFRIKQSTESNHENKTSKDVVPLLSCVHPKRTCVVSMISRVRKICGLRFDFVLEVEKKEFMMVYRKKNAV